jgi:lysophospholipase L1-like esterase
MKTILIHRLLIVFIFPAAVLAQHQRTDHWVSKTDNFKKESVMSEQNRVIFLGNSLTEGFDLQHYFPKTMPLNRGISGDHIDGLIERFEYSVKTLNPTKLYVMIGINDIGAGDTDSLILSNYKHLLEIIARDLPRTETYIQSILPTSSAWTNCPKEKIKKINTEIKSAAIHLGFNWIDLYSFFKTGEDYLNMQYSTDGLHLNPEGYLLWYEVLKQNGME